MDKIEELYQMLPKGSFTNVDELRSYVSKNGVGEFFDSMPQGAFSDKQEYENYFSNGLKKKDYSQSTAPKKELASVSENGFSDASGLPIGNKAEGVFTENEFNTLVKDVKEEAIQRKIDKQKRIDETLNLFNEATTENPSDVTYLKNELEAEREVSTTEKIIDGALTTIKKFAGFPTSSAETKTIPFEKELKEVQKKALKNGTELTKEEAQKEAEDLFIQNKKDNLFNDRASKFLSDLNLASKVEASSFLYKTINGLSEENKKLAEANASLKEFLTLGAEDLKKRQEEFSNNKENVTEADVVAFNNLQNNLLEKYKIYERNQNKLITNTKDLQSAEKEYDLFRRTYDGVFIQNFATSTSELVVGGIDFINYIGQFGSPLSPYIPNSEPIIDTSKIRKSLEADRENLRKPVESVESLDGFLNYTSDLIANQLPILAVTSTGTGGLAAIGATSTGQKYAEMTDAIKKGEADYEAWQMMLVPLGNGAAEAIFEIPTLSILKKGGRVLKSALKETPSVFKEPAKQTFQSFAKDYIKENLAEQGTNLIQNGLNIYALGEEGNITDNALDVFKDTSTMTLLLQGTPHIMARALKPFQPKDNIKILEENAFKMKTLFEELNNANLTETEKGVIEEQIKKLTKSSSNIMRNTILDVSKMDDETRNKIVDINKKAGEIRRKAKDIIDNGTSNNKKSLLSELENQHKALQEERIKVLNEYHNKPKKSISIETNGKKENLDTDGFKNFIENDDNVQSIIDGKTNIVIDNDTETSKILEDRIAQVKNKNSNETTPTKDTPNDADLPTGTTSNIPQGETNAVPTTTNPKPSQAETGNTGQESTELDQFINQEPTKEKDIIAQQETALQNAIDQYGEDSPQAKQEQKKLDIFNKAKDRQNPTEVTFNNGKTTVNGSAKYGRQQTQQKAIKEAINNGIYDNIPDTDISEASNPEEVTKEIAEKSQSPIEVANEIERVREVNNPQREQEEDIEAILLGGVNTKSYEHQTGLKSKDRKSAVNIKYIRKNGHALDDLARQIEEVLYGDDYDPNNSRVTEDDVVDWMDRLADGSSKTDEQIALEQRFAQLTGLPPTKNNVQLVANRSNKKADHIPDASKKVKNENGAKKGSAADVTNTKVVDNEIVEVDTKNANQDFSHIKPIGKGFFGNIYDQFKGKAKEAVAFLMQNKEGEAIGALNHKDVGDIDLVWGNEKAGLKKIADKHPNMLDDLQGRLNGMKVVSASDNRIILESEDARAVVSKNVLDEDSKNWLLTAYETKKNIASDSSIDIESEPSKGKQNGTATPQSNVSNTNIQKESETDDFWDNLDETDDEVPFSLADNQKPFETDSTEPATFESLQKAFPDAEVVQSETDLPKPIKDNIKRQKAEGRVKGVYHDGKVYIVADNVKTIGEATGTYRHEMFGHKGVINELGNNLKDYTHKIVNKAYGKKLKALREIAERYGLSTDIKNLSDAQKQLLGEEYVAHIAEKKTQYPGLWQDIINQVRKILRDLGIDLSITDAEVEALIRKVEKNKAKANHTATRFQKDYAKPTDFDSNGNVKPEVLREIQQERQRIKAEAKANGTFLKAPNGKPTKLNEQQWVDVRTSRFKEWFGDWELANKFDLIDNTKPTPIKPNNFSTKQIKEIYYGLENGVNKFDNRNVRFVNSTLGKILRHKGFDTKQIIPKLKDIFDNSVPILSEAEQQRKGHKPHPNFKGYYHYLGKVNVDGKEMFVRFTVQEKNAKPQTIKKGFVPNELHSTFISDIEIYNANPAVHTSIIPKATNTGDGVISDTKLQNFFKSAKKAQENTSKVVDQNGEPMVVYHGTNAEFNEFTPQPPKFYYFTEGQYYFTDNKDVAKTFGNKLIPVFLNIDNPTYHKGIDVGHGIGKTDLYDDYGNYGIIISEADTGGGIANEYIVENPNQIKSADNNVGTFSENTGDIRFQKDYSKPSDFDSKGNVKPEVLQEIKAERERIKAEAKANGIFMKAPNGKPTKLNQKQWIDVRTTRFKEWFGDWELMQKETEVVKATSNFKNIAQAKNHARKNFQGKSFVNKDTGETIEISGVGINKSLSDSALRKSKNKTAHVEAIGVLDKIIENSILAETTQDRNNDPNIGGVQRFYGAIDVNGETYRTKTTVKKVMREGNKFYTYEIQETEVIRERPANGKKDDTNAARQSTSPTNSVSMANILKNAVKNNGQEFNTEYSKVVDSNGEPLGVYHGTNTKKRFNTFNTKESPSWFTPNESYAVAFKNPKEKTKTYQTTLSLKNPLFVGDIDGIANENKIKKLSEYSGIGEQTLKDILKESNGNNIFKITNSKKFKELVAEKGYDGIEAMEGGTKSFAVFSPNQIKSADNNVGTYSKASGDIRFQIKKPKNKQTTEHINVSYGNFSTFEKNINIVYENINRFYNAIYPNRRNVQDNTKNGKYATSRLQNEPGNKGLIGARENSNLESRGNNKSGRLEDIQPNHILEGFKESGYVDFTGKKINSAKDLADLYLIHRSPLIEKGHVVYLKNGRIFHTTAMTAGIPYATGLDSSDNIKNNISFFKADEVYLIHNHPSGNHIPSQQDLNETKAISKAIGNKARLKHIVIDSDKFSLIDAKGNYTEQKYKQKPKSFYSKRYAVRGRQERLFSVAEHLSKGKAKHHIIYLDPKTNINGYEVLTGDELNILQTVKNGLKVFGATTFAVVTDGTSLNVNRLKSPMVKNRLDFIQIKDDSAESMANPTAVATPKNYTRLWEEITNYKQATEQDAVRFMLADNQAASTLSNLSGKPIPLKLAKEMQKFMDDVATITNNSREIFEAGMEFLQSTSWYENLSAEEKILVDQKTFLNTLGQLVKNVRDTKKKLSALNTKYKEKAQNDKDARKIAVEVVKTFIDNEDLNKRFTGKEIKKLLKKSTEIATRQNVDKAVEQFIELFEKLSYTESVRTARFNSTKIYLDKSGRIKAEGLKNTEEKKLKSLSNAILDLSKALKQKIIYTKQKGRTLGSYNPSSTAIRIKRAGDLDTVAHEIGHSIDDAFGLLSANDNPLVEKELMLLAPYGSKPPKGYRNPEKYKKAEGFAEFIRAFVVNPEETQSKFPNLYKLYENNVSDLYKVAIKNFSDDVRLFTGASGFDKILSNIQTKPDKKVNLFQKIFNKTDLGENKIGFWDKLNANIFNPNHIFEKSFKYLQGIRGIDEVLPENDPRLLARLLFGIDGKAVDFFNVGAFDSKLNILLDKGEPMNLAWLFSSLDTTTENTLEKEKNMTIAYMVAERTIELSNKFGRNNVITGIGGGIIKDLATAKQAINEFKNLDAPTQKRIKEAVRRYRKMSNNLLKYLVEKGRLSKEQYDIIKENNIAYVALQRIAEAAPGEEVIVVHKKGSKKLGSSSDIVYKIKGSTKKIQDPYQSLEDTVYKGIREADRNEVLLKFRDMLVNNRDIGAKGRIDLSHIGEIVPSGTVNTVKIFVDGKIEHWRFHPEIYKMFKGLDGEYQRLPKFLTILPTILRETVTKFPVFAIRNIARDTQDRLIKSKHKGLNFIGDKAHWEEVSRAGGLNAGWYKRDVYHYYGLQREAYKKIAQNKNTYILDGDKFKNLWKRYENLLQKGETLNRVAEYRGALRDAKKQGMDDYNAMLYAAYRSRDLIDFALMGHTMKVVNQMVPFSNAAVQGLRSGIARFKENPKSFIVRTALYSIIPQVALFALRYLTYDDDDWEEYENLPDYQRDMFYNFKLADDIWISIPKPYELGVASAGVDRALSVIFKKNDNAFDGYLKTSIASSTPLDEGLVFGGLKPVIEAMTNYDSFRGKNIVPIWEINKKISDRKSNVYASKLGKTIQSMSLTLTGENNGIDARKVDFLIKSMFSYYGKTAISLSEIGVEGSSHQFSIRDLGFFKNSPAYNSKDVQKYMEYAEKNSLTSTNIYKAFKTKVTEYFDAPTSKERELKAKELREKAKEGIKELEEYVKKRR